LADVVNAWAVSVAGFAVAAVVYVRLWHARTPPRHPDLLIGIGYVAMAVSLVALVVATW
jgi:Na+/proline symporter